MESEEAILEIETYIKSIPSNYKLFLGTGNKPEDELRVACDLPQYWFYRQLSSTSKAQEIVDYFERKGYTIRRDFGRYRQRFGDRFFLFAMPK